MKLAYLVLLSAVLLLGAAECKSKNLNILDTLEDFAKHGPFHVIKSDGQDVEISVTDIYHMLKDNKEARDLLGKDKSEVTYFAAVNGKFSPKDQAPRLSESVKYQTAKGRHAEAPGTYEVLDTFLKAGEKGVDLPSGTYQRVVLEHGASDRPRVEFGSPEGRAEIYGAPVECSNGLLYFVDKFFTIPRPLGEDLQVMGMGEYGVEYQKTDLENVHAKHHGTTGFTYFVPELSNDNIKLLAANINMTAFFLNHEVKGVFYSHNLADLKVVTAVGGHDLNVQVVDAATGAFTVNGQSVLRYDFPVHNGVAYFIGAPADFAVNGRGGTNQPVQFNNTNSGSGSNGSGSSNGSNSSNNTSNSTNGNTNGTKNKTSSGSSILGTSFSSLMTVLASASISASLFFLIAA